MKKLESKDILSMTAIFIGTSLAFLDIYFNKFLLALSTFFTYIVLALLIYRGVHLKMYKTFGKKLGYYIFICAYISPLIINIFDFINC